MPKSLRVLAVFVGLVLAVAFSAYIPGAIASRNSSGTYSLPSGNPVISGQSISSSWANTTLSDISTELTNSLDRSGRGAMSAPLQLSTGSCAAPSLTFSSDTDVGLYRAGANDTKMCIASTAVQRWTATGVEFPLAATITGALAVNGAVTAATGLTVNQATTNTTALTVNANGNAAAIVGNSTATSGSIGVWGVATTNSGVYGTATSGTGVNGVASTSGVGTAGHTETGIGVFGEATGAGVGVGVGSGNLKFYGSNPSATTGFTNTVTPSNVPKAWASISTNGTGGATLQSGFNIDTVTVQGSYGLRVTFKTALSSANMAAAATAFSRPSMCFAVARATTYVEIQCYDVGTGDVVDLTATSGSTLGLMVTVFGVQ